jgi:hypothetical protein
MTLVNLAVRFVVELLGVGALGYWGVGVSHEPLVQVLLGVGAPLLLIVTWARVVAPKAVNPLRPQVRVAIGTVLLLVAAGALGVAGQPVAAALLAAVVLLNQLFLVVLGSDVPPAIAHGAGPRA